MTQHNHSSEFTMTVANAFFAEIDHLLECERKHVAQDVRFEISFWLQSLLYLRYEDDPFLVYVQPDDGEPDEMPLTEAETLGIIRRDQTGVFAFERGSTARPGLIEVNGDISIIVEHLLQEYADEVSGEGVPILSPATLDRARERYEELTGEPWRSPRIHDDDGGDADLGGHRFIDFVPAPSRQYAHAAEDADTAEEAQGIRWLSEREGSTHEIIAWQDPREPARLQFKWLRSDGRLVRPSSPMRFQVAGVDLGRVVFSEGYSDLLLESEAQVQSLLEPSERITIRLEVDDL